MEMGIELGVRDCSPIVCDGKGKKGFVVQLLAVLPEGKEAPLSQAAIALGTKVRNLKWAVRRQGKKYGLVCGCASDGIEVVQRTKVVG